MAVKNAIFKKKIENTIYELMFKTTVQMVQYSSELTLNDKLDLMLADISSASNTLSTLLGGDTASKISTQISTAITNLKTEMEDTTDSTSLGYKVQQNVEAIEAINNVTTGILAQANSYTDGKIGLNYQAYATVKAYVDAVKAEISAATAGAFHFKGTVDYVSSLDSVVDPEEGDTYQVRYRGTSGTTALNAEYAYDGSNWVELGSIVDLSAYWTSTEVQSAITNARVSILGVEASDTTSTATSIAQALVDELTDTTDNTSLASRIGANEQAIAAINNATTGILAQAKDYTDGQIGIDIGDGANQYDDVKDYVDQTTAAAITTAEGYTDNQIGINIGSGQGQYADAKAYIDEKVGGTAHIYASTTEPANLTTDDLWIQLIEE